MCKNKRVVIFGVPGAFTPTCHTQHVQGFMDRFSEFAKFNIESISCIASNDVFVMGAWAKQLNAKSLLFLADGNLEFLGKIGLTQDLSAFGLGVRGHRFAMIVDDCKVLYLGVGDLEVSGAEAVLNKLQTLFA